ncbi:MAG: T9SS type A sorting domain-containing protein [candidate division WOR-3 bacterium]
MKVLFLAIAFVDFGEPGGLFAPQAIETLRVDDGIPTGVAGLPIPGDIELVGLPVPGFGRIKTLLYYPGRLLGFETPILHWFVFNDDGPGGLPGTPLGFGTAGSLYYDSWYAVDVSVPPIIVDPGYVYVGWMTDTSLNPLVWYQNWYDSGPDGYNYLFSITDTAWVQDTITPGDYMVRAIFESIDVDEGEREREFLAVFPNPSLGEVVFLSGSEAPVSLRIYEPSGRLVFSREFSGQVRICLPQGVYLYKAGRTTGVLAVR